MLVVLAGRPVAAPFKAFLDEELVAEVVVVNLFAVGGLSFTPMPRKGNAFAGYNKWHTIKQRELVGKNEAFWEEMAIFGSTSPL